MVVQERQTDGSFKPTMVFQGTPQRVDWKALPGDVRRETFATAALAQASRPYKADGVTVGTWEDWIDWAAYAFSNGYTMWCVMVEPEATVEQTFNREVLHVQPKPMTPANLRPTDVIPESLGGYKKVKPAP
jgi:hypothetical protein